MPAGVESELDLGACVISKITPCNARMQPAMPVARASGDLAERSNHAQTPGSPQVIVPRAVSNHLLLSGSWKKVSGTVCATRGVLQESWSVLLAMRGKTAMQWNGRASLFVS